MLLRKIWLALIASLILACTEVNGRMSKGGMDARAKMKDDVQVTIAPTSEPDGSSWTKWYSVSTPKKKKENELLRKLRRTHPNVCVKPITTECRIKSTKKSWETADQVFKVKCGPKGLLCINDKQKKGEKCLDYEVRYLCPRDVDECAQNSTMCAANAECVNLSGSYLCRCRPGFIGDAENHCYKFRTCSGSGDPHYRTFDGLKRNFMGVCTYTFVQFPGIEDKLDAFRVAVSNEQRSSKKVSFTKSVTLYIGGTKIQLGKGDALTIDGVSYAPTQRRTIRATGTKLLIMRESKGLSIDISTGVRITFDGKSAVKVHVSVDLYKSANLSGLCGNFDGDVNNDFATKEGSQEQNPAKWGDTWIDPEQENGKCGKSEEIPTKLCDDETSLQITKLCSQITKQGGVFEECHSKVSPVEYFDNCYFDYCSNSSNKELMCNAMADYAIQCQENGVSLKWRKTMGCYETCQTNAYFNEEASGCQDTCQDPDATTVCHLPRVEGCVCGEGFFLSGNDCISDDDCGCIDHNGNYRKVGDKWFTNDCTTLNECESGSTISQNNSIGCHDNGECVLRPDTDEYDCKCKKGFEGSGYECLNINECAKNNHDCQENSQCVDTHGSYECACAKGFAANGNDCTDKDECNDDPKSCPENSQCLNTFGSFECTCVEGYHTVGKDCVKNKDEKKTCSYLQDILCDPQADCTETETSIECSCPEGLIGNGYKNGTGCKYSDCEEGQFGYKGYCYEVLINKTTFNDAKEACALIGGKLASIVSGPELAHISVSLQNKSPKELYLGYDLLSYPGYAIPFDYSVDSFVAEKVKDNLDGNTCLVLAFVAADTYEIKASKCSTLIQGMCKIPNYKWACPDGWKHIGQKCMGEFSQTNSFIEGSIHCAMLNADPVTIMNKNEQTFAWESFTQMKTSIEYYIGLQQRLLTPVDILTWATNPLNYSNYETSPSSSSGDKISCVTINEKGKWSDPTDKCDNKLGMICEKPDGYLYRCPPTAFYFNHHCYTFGHDTTQAQGSIYCQKMGGQLTSILTVAENDFVNALLKPKPESVKEFWFGLVHSENDNYKWADYSVYDYTLLSSSNITKVSSGSDEMASTNVTLHCGTLSRSSTGVTWVPGKNCSDENPTICKYINEPCRTNDNCNTNAICNSGQCRCAPGFKLDPILLVCKDINECDNPYACAKYETCANSIGSYTCTCITDYVRNSKQYCEHYRHCNSVSDCISHATCNSTNMCVCDSGYTGDGKKSCDNINECSSPDLNDCHKNGICTDTDGSYTCACGRGYSGDGIKECIKIPHNCDVIYKSDPKSKDGDFKIDPDEEGEIEPITVYCEFTGGYGITIFKHNIEKETKLKWNENSTISIDFEYTSINLEAIRFVVQKSGYCYQDMTYQCISSINLVEKTTFTDYNGTVHTSWGITDVENTCLCGKMGVCENPDSKCNCDGSAPAKTDKGRLFGDKAKNLFPLRSVQTGSFGERSTKRKASILFEPLKCGPSVFGIPTSCDFSENKEDGLVLIDTDGPDGNEPFYVYCDVIHYDKKVIVIKTIESPDEGINPPIFRSFHWAGPLPKPPQPSKDGEVCYKYSLSSDQINSIKKTHTCYQEVRFDCEKKAKLLNDYTYLMSNGKKLDYFGSGENGKCACGVLGSCRNPESACNCDGKSDDAATDFGFIYDQENLPISCRNVKTSDDEKAYLSVGPLICAEKSFGIEQSCQNWIIRGYEQNYAYMINVGGKTSKPVLVQCEMHPSPRVGYTVIPPIYSEKCTYDETNKLCRYTVDYPFPKQVIEDIKDPSFTYCTQEIDYTCGGGMTLLKPYDGSTKTPFAGWEDADAKEHNYFSGNGTVDSCQCGLDGDCSQCACNAGDKDEHMDKGELINTKHLPVYAVMIGGKPGDSDVVSKFRLGPLRCTALGKVCSDEFARLNNVRGSRWSSWYDYFDMAVDPDHEGVLPPMTASCEYYYWSKFKVSLDKKGPFTESVTITHTDEKEYYGKEKKCYDIYYEDVTHLKQLKTYIELSSYCFMKVSYEAVSAPFTDYVKWYHNDNQEGVGWGDSVGGSECLCGEVDRCEGGPDLACEADAKSSKMTTDKGYLSEVNMQPLTRICAGLDESSTPKGVSKKQIITIGHLFCSDYNHNNLYRSVSCQHYRNKLGSIEANYGEPKVIQLGSKYNAPMMAVYCNYIKDPPIGETVITRKGSCSEKDAEGVEYNAVTTSDMLKTLKELSSYCEQTVNYDCAKGQKISGSQTGIFSVDGKEIDNWPESKDGPCGDPKAKGEAIFGETSDLPISKYSRWDSVCIADLKCYNIYRNCLETSSSKWFGLNDYKKEKTRYTYVPIDPDQGAGLRPFPANCLDSFRITRITKSTSEIDTFTSEFTKNKVIDFSYHLTSIEQLRALIKLMAFCYQNVVTTTSNKKAVEHGVPQLISYDKKEYSTWALSDIIDIKYKGCVCGVFQNMSVSDMYSCSESTASCESDVGDSETITEGGLLTNKDDLLPVTGIRWMDYEDTKSEFTLDGLSCTHNFEDLPKDCDEFLSNENPEGPALLSPDATTGALPVICKRFGKTIVTIIVPLNPRGKYESNVSIKYTGSSSLIQLVIKRSTYCIQLMRLQTKKVSLSKIFSWNKLDGEPQKYAGAGTTSNFCSCGVQNSCANTEKDTRAEASKRQCNGDLDDGELHVDAGSVSDKNLLPVEVMNFAEGSNDNFNYYLLGELMCAHQYFDLDACSSNDYNDCHTDAECSPKSNSGYECECKNGYRGLFTPYESLANGRSCYDDNECAKVPSVCDLSTSTCVNNYGSYTCKCLPGFKREETNKCVDINECDPTVWTHNCDKNALCRNLQGSFSCICKPGYMGSGVKGSCKATAQCSCWGDPHCRTFDNRIFDYMGSCSYTAARDGCENNVPKGQPNFNIITKYWRQNTKRPVSWVKEINYITSNELIGMKLGNMITSHGEKINLPYESNDISIKYSGDNIQLIDSFNHVEVIWDSKAKFLINIPGELKNKVCGMCGNYNSNPEDDLVIGPKCKPVGKKTSIVTLFGDSWRDDRIAYTDPDCEHKCSEIDPPPCEEPLLSKAKTECENVRAMFKECEKAMKEMGVNLDEIVEGCKFDYCHVKDNSSGVLCATAQNIYDICRTKYKIVIKYRNPQFCPYDCGTNQHFTPCKPVCVPTCDPEMDKKCLEENANVPCAEGCDCLSGYVYDNGKCIKKEECGCKDRKGNYILDNTETINSNCSEKTICHNSKVTYEPMKCVEHSTCRVKNYIRNCYCVEGYFLNGTSCNDIDECEKEIDKCSKDADCTNTVGSYKCDCKKGYTGDGLKCDNIDECKDKPCNKDTEECFDMVPGYECRCAKGYVRIDGTCKDVDECEENKNDCDGVSTDCENVPGTYKCNCKTGFKITKNPKKCDDIPECSSNTTNDCNTVLGICIEGIGSYRCECKKGYTGDGRNCTDINECEESKNATCPEQNCFNTNGSYYCECIPGTPDCDIDPCAPDRKNCTEPHTHCRMGICYCDKGYTKNSNDECDDENECEKKLDDCATKNAFCVNTEPGYFCKCLKGYKWNPKTERCDDINECIERLHNCSYPSICVNTNPGYYCICDKGFAGHCDECRDINECDLKAVCDKQHGTCTNTVGSYKCGCQVGYDLVEETCYDIDECKVGIHDCISKHSICVNSVGSYNCRCEDGYIYEADGSCEDKNECDNPNWNSCDLNAECENKDGSYQCTCRGGYIGDGRKCQPDEYHTKCGDVICDRNAECILNHCVCRNGFTVENRTGHCNDVDECKIETTCDTNAFCLNIPGSVVCTCKTGYIGTGTACYKEDTKRNLCEHHEFCVGGLCENNKCTCYEGFELINNKCEDINECDEKNMCPGQLCANQPGGYECGCNTGLTLVEVENSTIKECRTIDACSLGYHECGTNSYCVNDARSGVKCECEPGYLPLNDISSECARYTPTCKLACPTGAYCTNDKCECAGDLEAIEENGKLKGCKSTKTFCKPDICGGVGECTELQQGGFTCSCPDGYLSLGTQCIDINECLLETDTCGPYSMCKNTLGSFKCSCQYGYEMKNGTCVNTHVCQCGSHGICKDSVCICDPGYEPNSGGVCVDIDECTHSPGPCHALATCTNSIGSFTCQCPKNYEGDGYKFCDLDECKTMMSLCGPGETCKNTPGDYFCEKSGCPTGYLFYDGRCIEESKFCSNNKVCGNNAACSVSKGEPMCLCNPGYQGDGVNCMDIDECSSFKENDCSALAICINEVGSYRCECKKGFEKDASDSSGKNCVDIEECSDPNACAKHANCTNTVGSYQCTCSKGYIGEGKTGCHLDSKCTSLGGCHTHASCTLDSTKGIYTCVCKPGFSGDGIRSCEDINECDSTQQSQCHPNAICSNSNGAFTCSCPEDFVGDGYKYCVKEDKCLTNPCTGKLEKCVADDEGSYVCSCQDGTEKDDKGICQDIDECQGSGKALCSSAAICQNTVGSFVCQCQPGFVGDGIHCSDIDECNGFANCSVNAFCINKESSFQCKCQAGYEGDGFNCTDVNECLNHKNLDKSRQCSENAECTNLDPHYKCECKEGYRGNGFDCMKMNPCDVPGVCKGNSTCLVDSDTHEAYCNCFQGFKKDDKGDCTVVNECKEKLDNCDKGTEYCRDLLSGFECICLPGYKRVDGVCKDKDECDPDSVDFKAGACLASGGSCKNSPGYYTCNCPGGGVASDKGSCTSLNECRSGKNNCHPKAYCVDTKEGFECHCAPGYEGNGTDCTDMNECENTNICGEDYKCINIEGSYNCSCPEGYQPDISGKKCKDIDECFANPEICKGSNVRCINTEGSFKCSCVLGFVLNEKTGLCEDMDECEDDRYNPCHEHAECTNTFGSCTCKCSPGYTGDGKYNCQATDNCPGVADVKCPESTVCKIVEDKVTCACQTGYSEDESGKMCNDTMCIAKCNDINECITKKDVCHSLAKCTNNAGQYVCKCPETMTGDGRKGCMDIDECADLTEVCNPKTSVCENLDATKSPQPYKCVCLKGYIMNPNLDRCEDVNECEFKELNDCHRGEFCTNYDGGYSCGCPEGFLLDTTDNTTCVDINECVKNPTVCGNDGKCVNLQGSFSCNCPAGFENSGSDKTTCVDINECERSFVCTKNGEVCTNTPGSYKCHCKEGYTRKNEVCIDVNECSIDEFKSKCKGSATCKNKVGSFSCECPPGSKRVDEYMCLGVNECSSDLNNCAVLNGNSSICKDEDEGYSCICPPGYELQTNSRTVCIDSNECANDPCPASAICKNTMGSYTCTCKPAYKQTEPNKCEDRDECAEAESEKRDQCKPGKCQNLIGGYDCQCPANYEFKNGQCEDIDECSVSNLSVQAANCGKGSVCINKAGGYDCRCSSGYKLEDNVCVNINECQHAGTCPYGKCVDVDGSYACDCPKGFVYDVKSKSCQKINECQFPERCGDPSMSRCIYEKDRVRCECMLGSRNVNEDPAGVCESINFCYERKDPCPPNHVCVNARTTSICECVTGYTKNELGVCVNVNECDLQNDVCHHHATCTDTDGGYLCECKLGYRGDGYTKCKPVCKSGTCRMDQTCRVTAQNTAECTCSCDDPDQCDADPSNVCGGDGVTYSSVKELILKSCQRQESTSIGINYYGSCKDNCEDVDCPQYHHCEATLTGPKCVCDICTESEINSGPVCSTLNMEYLSECDMQKARCANKKIENVKNQGTCLTPIPCHVTTWSTWSACSTTCGLGQVARKRSVSREAKQGGHCPYKLVESSQCYLGPCPKTPCETTKCHPGAYCQSTGKDETYCQCLNDCPTADGPQSKICGQVMPSKSLNTYHSVCHMLKDSCLKNVTSNFLYRGKCGDPEKTSPMLCSVVMNYETLTDNGCTSINPVPVGSCDGGCGESADVCCRAKREREVRVQFQCGGEGVVVRPVKMAAECECVLEKQQGDKRKVLVIPMKQSEDEIPAE